MGEESSRVRPSLIFLQDLDFRIAQWDKLEVGNPAPRHLERIRTDCDHHYWQRFEDEILFGQIGELPKNFVDSVT